MGHRAALEDCVAVAMYDDNAPHASTNAADSHVDADTNVADLRLCERNGGLVKNSAINRACGVFFLCGNKDAGVWVSKAATVLLDGHRLARTRTRHDYGNAR